MASAMSVKLGKREYLVRKTRPPVVSDPAEVLQVLGLTPDDWQTEYLASDADVRMLFSTRQAGKTEISAVCAVLACATTPELYAPIVASRLDQAAILARRAHRIIRKLQDAGVTLPSMPVPQARYSPLQVPFDNGSRLHALPASECAVRGETATGPITVDEAARVPDEVWTGLLPQRAMTNSQLNLLTTPWYQSGRFFELWTARDQEGVNRRRWRVIAPPDYAARIGLDLDGLDTCGLDPSQAPDVPVQVLSRMTWEGFLSAIEGMTQEEIRREMFGIFSNNAGHSLFGVDAIRRALSDDVSPLWASGAPTDPDSEDDLPNVTPLWSVG